MNARFSSLRLHSASLSQSSHASSGDEVVRYFRSVISVDGHSVGLTLRTQVENGAAGYVTGDATTTHAMCRC